MDKEIEIFDIWEINICFNTIVISGYKKNVFGIKRPIHITLGQKGVLTNIIDKECKITYPRDKILQSNAVKTIKIGEEMK